MAQRKDAKPVAAPDSDADACSPVELVPAEDQDILEFHGCTCNMRRIVDLWVARGDLTYARLCADFVRRPSCPGD